VLCYSVQVQCVAHDTKCVSLVSYYRHVLC